MLFLKELFKVFYPSLCVNCSTQLLGSEAYLCTNCLYNLPLINYNEATKEMLQAIFYGQLVIEEIYSFLYFSKHGITQKLIHELKYKGQEEIGAFIGKWIGHEILKLGIFKGIDYIIPVPLHPSKRKKRGYNQLTKFGKTLSLMLDIPYKPGVLLRKSKSKTQTSKQRFERFLDLDSKFNLSNTAIFKNKHVLVIDDVITTGASLIACCNELLKSKNIKISICTMAYTELA
ncbi:MAG: ComF family protein [Tenacibaculum sp.]